MVVASVDTCQDCSPSGGAVPSGYGCVTAPAGSWAVLTPLTAQAAATDNGGL